MFGIDYTPTEKDVWPACSFPRMLPTCTASKLTEQSLWSYCKERIYHLWHNGAKILKVSLRKFQTYRNRNATLKSFNHNLKFCLFHFPFHYMAEMIKTIPSSSRQKNKVYHDYVNYVLPFVYNLVATGHNSWLTSCPVVSWHPRKARTTQTSSGCDVRNFG